MQTVSSPEHPANSAGFSLVEVALAIGVVAFAFVGLLALLPAGLTTFRRAIDTSMSAQIAQRVINDAQQSDFDVLIDEKALPSNPDDFTFRAPRVHEPGLRYFDEQGNEIVPKTSTALSTEEQTRVIYHVNVRVTPRAPLPKTNTGGDSRHLALITVQVAQNPSNRVLPIKIDPPAADDEDSPERNLIDPATPGISVQTFSALVGRNQ